MPIDTDSLKHPTTLKVFTFLRKYPNRSYGARETQREIGLKSHTTALWHLNKLEEAGILEKTPDNRFNLTPEGKELTSFDVPYQTRIYMIRHRIIPETLVFYSFLFTALIIDFTLLIFKSTRQLGIIYMALVIIAIIGFGIIQFRKLPKQEK